MRLISLGARQGQFIAQAEVDGEPVGRPPVVLEIPGMREILRGDGDIHAVAAAALREADQERRQRIATGAAGRSLRGARLRCS